MIVVSDSDNPDDPYEDTSTINNQGEIALTLDHKGYIWRNRHLRQLQSVGNAIVNALNDLGQVVGGSYEVDDGAILAYPGDAILWNGGRVITLGSVCGFSDSIAIAINNDGEIVGTSGPASPGEDGYGDANPDQNALDHVFLWKKSRMTDLGKGEVAAINDAGQVAGTLPPPLPPGDDVTYGHHAAVWKYGQWHPLADCHGWAYVQATGINKEGSVCGYGYNADSGLPSEAFMWHHNAVADLGRGHTWAINGTGQVVGDSGGHTVLWWHGRRCDLNSVSHCHGWTLTKANGINDAGQIVGNATRRGEYCLFLLTPTR